MCLAVPGKIVERREADALVDFQGTRVKVSLALTPGAAIGDWVLVHAGFAINRLDERDALETWSYLNAIEVAGDIVADGPAGRGSP